MFDTIRISFQAQPPQRAHNERVMPLDSQVDIPIPQPFFLLSSILLH
jgi:hypothetical protein